VAPWPKTSCSRRRFVAAQGEALAAFARGAADLATVFAIDLTVEHARSSRRTASSTKTGSEAIRLTLERPASAELAEDQSDERDLMPFPVLGACLHVFAGEKTTERERETVLVELSPEEHEHVAGWVKRFVAPFAGSIFEWVHAPLAIHVGNLDRERARAAAPGRATSRVAALRRWIGSR